MKQTISSDQWNELRKDEQDYILGELNGYKAKDWKKDKLLTIGELLEFLGDDLELNIGLKFDKGKNFVGKPLIDALFEATKYKLNKD